jgi:hypothetical protein
MRKMFIKLTTGDHITNLLASSLILRQNKLGCLSLTRYFQAVQIKSYACLQTGAMYVAPLGSAPALLANIYLNGNGLILFTIIQAQ